VFEVFALRYGSTLGTKAARYHRFETYAEPDADAPLDFYFWLARNEAKTVLVDCGYDDVRTKARGYLQARRPVDLLAEMGVRPADVDHVVLTHFHFDHIGNVDLFPNATFSVARAELEFWTGPLADRPHLNFAGDPAEIKAVASLGEQERLVLVEGTFEVVPGMSATVVGGHTLGQMIATVSTGSGEIVLASDAAHLYEEYEMDRPYWLFADLPAMYRAYEILREAEARSDALVIPGHDPGVMHRFHRVSPDIVDLTRPIAG